MLYIASYILIIICFTRYKPNTINLIFEISTIQISMLQNFVESKGPLNLKTLYLFRYYLFCYSIDTSIQIPTT